MSLVRRLVVSVCACLALGEPVVGQTPLPVFDPYRVQVLSFRPGSRDDLLMGVSDGEYRLQAHLARIGQDGKHQLLRTLPGFHAALAWLDAATVISADDKGNVWKWPADGGAQTPLVAL
ncbi:MAG TPA: hypothetical protein VEC14_03405, partial [Reyranellaceae bacterium]|nr:hypothetical protein [Reyranellaceae bacterium]